MKVAGFSFIRNAVKYDYPIAEAILSILPLCDEFVVAIEKMEVVNSRELAKRMTDAGKKYVKRFSDNVIADEIMKIYNLKLTLQ
ncbi:MAG: hypothetical protein LBP63_02455 [Prevotellaceae bacterium]|jgi:L-fucose mutarotase/ribose pyranase (RbsD/FucU family)|nr:hypothetical protein [Prevotellaceae bacterium]